MNTVLQSARQAVILVGGKGTRLGDLTKNTPKPLMRIDDNSLFLDHVIFNIARQSFDEILLLAGHLGEQFIGRYHGKHVCGAAVRVIQETTPAGTGGALLNAADALQEVFLLANGDTFFDVNVRQLDRILLKKSDALGVMALRHEPDSGRYGAVVLENGYLTGFREKEQPIHGGALINAGAGVFRKDVLTFINNVPCSIESDVYPKLADQRRIMGHEFPGYFIDIGLPETLEFARNTLPQKRYRPALFLDRDGVINEDYGYTHKPQDLLFVKGAVDLIRSANDMGALVIVVTNQAGVAHGFYGMNDVEIFHEAMNESLNRHGAFIDAFYACPFHPSAKVAAFRHPDHPDRKPNPGMLLRAFDEWPILRERSILIGDKESDIAAAERAGIRGLLFDKEDLSSLKSKALMHLQRVC
ncbi:HAD-IIIA family hydrolase [Affinirhizobium pseudoryzae]|uniref:HAD-IIIA family hydrolase n=1 Tax=Allorhizobium pseudoryzae TaxID=379684 RepID=UPI001F3DA73A|nr:HAD-IIIA family hydrolase [Allorhizobium pseudoryzae]